MTGPLAGRRILVIEDEMLVLMNIERTLEGLGCTAIHAAASVVDALVMLYSYQFDAAIIDINLGGEKSYPVADELIKRRIPFAFSTGYGDHGDRRDLVDRPMLRKPYVSSALVAMFAQLMPDDPLPG